MKTKASLLALSLLMVGAVQPRAEQVETQDHHVDSPTYGVEISPFSGYRFGGEVRDAFTGRTYGFADSPAYGVMLDVAPPYEGPKFELLWSHQDSHVDLQGLAGINNVDVAIDEIQIGGILEKGDKHLRGYFSLLVGATHFSPDGYQSDTRFSLGIGGGAKWLITKNIGLRADLRGFYTVVDSSGGFISSNGGTVVTYSSSGFWQGQATLGLNISF
jgi:hypothetical protein